MAGAAPARGPRRFPDSSLRPGVPPQKGKVAPLHKVPAHGADHGGILAEALPHSLQQMQMTIVQGIIFSYDTSGFHICHLKAVTKKCQFGKNGDCILRRICYNEKESLRKCKRHIYIVA